MNRKECHGWTNYETWLAKLWMDEENYRSNSAQWCREYAEEYWAEGLKGFAADIVNAAIREVNWAEIAASNDGVETIEDSDN